MTKGIVGGGASVKSSCCCSYFCDRRLSFPRVTRFSSRSAQRPPHDGVRRAKRLNLFHDLAGLRPQAQDSQRDRLAHRSHGNDAFRSRNSNSWSFALPFMRSRRSTLGHQRQRRFLFRTETRRRRSTSDGGWSKLAGDRDTGSRHAATLGDRHTPGARADHFLLRTRSECAAS